MSELDDDAFVCQVSIPGAHDAGTGNLGLSIAGKTQAGSFTEMFNAGVRAFDMRPAVHWSINKGNFLELCHGILGTGKSFDDALSDLVNAVNNTGEFAVIIIRHEVDAIETGSNRYDGLLKASLDKISNNVAEFRPNLTIGEVRGKIIVLSREEFEGGPIGGHIKNWNHDSNFDVMQRGYIQSVQSHNAQLWIQDHFEVGNNTADNIKSNKTDLITGLMNRSLALQGSYSYTWVINHTSGYTGNGIAETEITNISAVTNPAVTNYLNDNAGPIGIIMEDFASVNSFNGASVGGLDCTHAVIENNFKYKDKMSKQTDIIYDGNNRYIAPRGRELMWTAKYVNRANSAGAPATNWYAEDFNDSSWGELRFPIANKGTNEPYYNVWDGEHNTMYIRRKFELAEPIPCAFRLFHDDDYTLYVNGVELDFERDWMTDFNNYRQVLIPASLLHAGTNVLAIKVVQNVGGAYFDCGVLSLVETADLENPGVLPSTQYGKGLPESRFDEVKYTATTWVKKQNAAGVIGVPSPVNGKAWYDPAYVATKENNWEVHTSSFFQDGNYKWAGGDNCDICFRREFVVNGTKPSELYLSIGHDDLCDVYLNGHLIWSEDGKVKTGTDAPYGPWYNQDVIKLTAEEIGYIHTDGTVNVLAVHVHQNWGGYFADAGLYTAGSNAANAFESEGKGYKPTNALLEKLAPYAKYLKDNETYKKGTSLVASARSIHDYEYIEATLKTIQVVTYDDGATNFFENKHYDAVIVKRSITPGNWSTLCLPFAMTGDQVKANFGETAEVGELTSLSVNGDAYKMSFTSPSSEPIIKAGNSYLIKATKEDEAITEIGVADVTIKAEENESVPVQAANGAVMTFIGSYNGGQVPMDAGNYVISDNKYYFVNSNVVNKGFRGYFHLEDKNGKALNSLSVSFVDETDGISNLKPETRNEEPEVYNLAGQRIETPVRGQMYIKNGKTYIAK